jgi:hypothetical protein
MAFTTSTRYANQSVIDLPVNVSGQVGTQGIPQPEPIHVAVVEFDDNGIYVDRRQIERAETWIDWIREVATGSENGWPMPATLLADTGVGD